MYDYSKHVVKVHFQENSDHQLQHITKFMFADGNQLDLMDMVFNITLGIEYFTWVNDRKSLLETFKLGSKYFVRTKGNNTKIDNLLSLPTF